MENLKVLVVVTSLIAFGAKDVVAQSRKEIIAELTNKSDSLQKVLASKMENIHELEVKLAKFEGAAEVNDAVLKRFESKSDSLTQLLSTKNNTIDELKAEVERLNAGLVELKEAQHQASNVNAALEAELNALKSQGNTPLKKEPAVTTTQQVKAKVIPANLKSADTVPQAVKVAESEKASGSLPAAPAVQE